MAYKDDIIAACKAEIPWEKLSGKNILITGATGLIGSTIVDILMHCDHLDFNVYALGRNVERAKRRFAKYMENCNFHFIRHDVTDFLQTDIDFHYMIAAASGASPTIYSTQPVEVMKTNFLGTDNMLRYGIQHNLEKFVYVSSGDVYGDNEEQLIKENYSGYVNPLHLRSCYSSVKRATESLCISYAHEYGATVSIARPCHTYGPFFTETDTRVYAQFINNILNNQDIALKSSGEQYRSWCYSVDCALGILYVLLKGDNMEAYNIADSDANITIRQLAKMIAKIGNKKIFSVVPDDIEKRGFSTIHKSCFDSSKLQSLGWKPLSSLEENLISTINECKNNAN